MTEFAWDEMFVVGRIIRPHGLRGEVVVAPETDFVDERFQPGARLFVGRNGAADALTIGESRVHAGRALLLFDGVTSMDEAEDLRGCELRVPGSELHALPPGAFYHHDLVGCVMRTAAGEVIGEVIRVDDGGGPPIVVAKGERGEVLVPFVDGILRSVDVAKREMVIAPPDGLLDVNVLKAKDRAR